jgi:hypothetical protein
MARNRIIYASQSVWANGEVLYRVQSLGTTTTFTSEDIFELGHLDIIDVVDDVPAVAVTLNTNEFGDVETFALLAQVQPAKRIMEASANTNNANLVSGATYLHGAGLADFAIVCGNLPGITMWAPVQDECSLGTLANNIDQTLFLDEVYVNSVEFGYTTGANATENYGAETDNKMWLLNDGRFVNYFEATLDAPAVASGYVNVPGTSNIAMLSTGYGFLRKSENGSPASTWYDATANEMMNIATVTGTSSAALTYVFDPATRNLYFPTDANYAHAVGDRVEAVYSADAYDTAAGNTYFEALNASDRPSDVGAVRQGQVEIYIVDPNSGASDFDGAWRLTGVTLSADLTREPLNELGHLRPYDRPLTLPIPITVTVDSTAGDLENWAKFAGQLAAFDADSLDDIDLTDLMTKDNLTLVVKIFMQTDEEAAGTGSNRIVAANSDLIGDDYFADGVMGTVTAGQREYALKTIVVKNLKITDEGATLDVGANMTQTFGFRSNNDLFVVKGDVSYPLVAGITRNA